MAETGGLCWLEEISSVQTCTLKSEICMCIFGSLSIEGEQFIYWVFIIVVNAYIRLCLSFLECRRLTDRYWCDLS